MTQPDDPNFDDEQELQALFSALQAEALVAQINVIGAEHPDVVQLLRPLHPVKAASAFAGLLTQKRLQSNCLRLEALVHLCVTYGAGQKTASAVTVGQVFRAIGNGWCGRAEDPAEDVFVANVMSPRGNFRVLEGIWESGGFFLQRTLNLIERLPNQPEFLRFKNSVEALLKLSDAVCGRNGLHRYGTGSAKPESAIPSKLLDQLATIRRCVSFDKSQLEALGIDQAALAPFFFDPDERSVLATQSIGHTALERRPLAWNGEELVFLLPTAVSAAIRRVFVERFGKEPNQAVCASELAREYGRLFSRTPLLGDQASAPVQFVPTEHGWLASMAQEVDCGRHLHVLFFVDPLDGFQDEGLAGEFNAFGMLADPIDEAIEPVYQDARASKDFRDGITLLVGCGLGRKMSLWLNNASRVGWRIETLSAPDLWTLSWAPKMKPLHLWRILSAQRALEERGLGLHNVNGLLNLVAWSRQLAGHLVPHADVPDEWSGNAQLMIDQNSLLGLRVEVAHAWDVHMAMDARAHWWPVRRTGLPLVPGARPDPVYAVEVGG